MRCCACAVLLLSAAVVAAQPAPPEVARLIEQLGSPRWEERQAASKRLPELGEAALEAMENAVRSNRDVDVRLRLWLAIAAVRDRGYAVEAVIKGSTAGYWLNRVAFTPDGKEIIAAGGGVIWFDPATGKEVRRTLEVNGARQGLALSSDGKRFLTGHTADPALHVGDAVSGQVLRSIPTGSPRGVFSVALTADGNRGVSAGIDRTLKLWDVETGKELRLWKNLAAAADSVALSADGKRLASGHQSPDCKVRLWSPATGEMIHELAGHTGRVHAVRFLPEGKKLLSASADGTLRLWDADSGKELRLMKHGGTVYDVAVSADGTRALSAGFEDRTVGLWDLTSGKLLYRFVGHETPVLGVAFSADGRRGASSDANCTIRIWRLSR